MKHLILISLISLLSLSCHKDDVKENNSENLILKHVKAPLKDSLSKADYAALNFDSCIITMLDNGKFDLLRVPFKGKSISNDFILLKVDKAGNFFRGLIIDIKGARIQKDRGVIFNGNINISSLDRTDNLSSPIVNGVITKFHPDKSFLRSQAQNVLPDVVVTCYIESGRGISYSDWCNLSGLFGSNSGGSSGVYSYMSGDNSGGGSNYGYHHSGSGYGSGSGSSGGGVGEDNTTLIDFEPISDQAIDVNSYLKCFSTIEDNGSSCSIEILTDIPVDTDPYKFFDWSNGSPGHTFLHLQKSNGDKIVSQYLGFYPKTGWKTIIDPSPIDGKFDDNGGHEFNASLIRNITADQLQGLIAKIGDVAKSSKYDIDNYNCTDFALELFNSVPNTNPIVIPRFTIPLGGWDNKTRTPQGVYIKLKSMKETNIESSNINMPTSKAFAGKSSGPCN